MTPKISVLSPSIRPRGLEVVQESLERQTFTSFEWLVEIGMPSRGCDLSAALNRMLLRSRGDIIVMLQDYLKIPHNAFEEIVKLHEKHDKTFITYSVAKTLDWKEVVPDWRYHGVSRKIEPREWEADFASAPRQAFFDVQGYNESFDRGWSCENLDLAERAKMAGYYFMVVPSLRAVAFDHDAKIKHPFRNKLNFNSDLVAIERDRRKDGEYKTGHL